MILMVGVVIGRDGCPMQTSSNAESVPSVRHGPSPRSK